MNQLNYLQCNIIWHHHHSLKMLKTLVMLCQVNGPHGETLLWDIQLESSYFINNNDIVKMNTTLKIVVITFLLCTKNHVLEVVRVCFIGCNTLIYEQLTDQTSHGFLDGTTFEKMFHIFLSCC